MGEGLRGNGLELQESRNRKAGPECKVMTYMEAIHRYELSIMKEMPEKGNSHSDWTKKFDVKTVLLTFLRKYSVGHESSSWAPTGVAPQSYPGEELHVPISPLSADVQSVCPKPHSFLV